jgi:hypothetical protein
VSSVRRQLRLGDGARQWQVVEEVAGCSLVLLASFARPCCSSESRNTGGEGPKVVVHDDPLGTVDGGMRSGGTGHQRKRRG